MRLGRVEIGSDNIDLGPQGAGLVNLHHGRALGHDDGGLDAHHGGMAGHALGMIAGRGCDHAACLFILGQG